MPQRSPRASPAINQRTRALQGLERVQSALAALAMVAERDEEGESDEHEAALSELQYEIDRLASSEGVCLRQD